MAPATGAVGTVRAVWDRTLVAIVTIVIIVSWGSCGRPEMETEEVQVNTSMGSFTVELYRKQAPKATRNFTEL